MAQNYIPRQDTDFFTFGTTLAQTLAADPTAYGLTQAEATALANAIAQVGQAIQDVDALKAELSSTVEQKTALRRTAEQMIRPLVCRIQANPTVTREQKAQAGLPLHDTKPSHIAPLPPTDLVVKADTTGLHRLTWDRNGNPFGTRFIVECQPDQDTDWRIVDIVEGTTLDHPGNTPGRKIIYRVCARRGKTESPPSNHAGAYL